MLKTYKHYCVHGHDTLKLGRSKNGTCRECQREHARRTRTLQQECEQDFAPEPPVQLALVLPARKRSKQFCSKGHDTYVVGRSGNGTCRQCMAEKNVTRAQRYAAGLLATGRLCEHGLEFRNKSGKCRKCARKHQLKWAYGVTPEWYDERAVLGCCICGKTQEEHLLEFKQPLAVDHCHTSSLPRGVLCMRCNQGLGSFLDCVPLLLRAAVYLSYERTSANLAAASA